jgi:high-affinity iron transporter
MVLINGAVLVLGATLLSQSQQASAPSDPAPLVRRLAATAQLAAQEYRVGIVDGRIVSPAEVDEARLFLQESRRSAAALPGRHGAEAVARIDSVVALLNRTASPDSIDARVRQLTSTVSAELGVTLDEIPSDTPSLARGAEVFQANCASCHGSMGRGDGPAAAGLDPKPTDLSGAALRDQSPLDYYRRITIGVVGTALCDTSAPSQPIRRGSPRPSGIRHHGTDVRRRAPVCAGSQGR